MCLFSTSSFEGAVRSLEVILPARCSARARHRTCRTGPVCACASPSASIHFRWPMCLFSTSSFEGAVPFIRGDSASEGFLRKRGWGKAEWSLSRRNAMKAYRSDHRRRSFVFLVPFALFSLPKSAQKARRYEPFLENYAHGPPRSQGPGCSAQNIALACVFLPVRKVAFLRRPGLRLREPFCKFAITTCRHACFLRRPSEAASVLWR